MLPLYFKKDMLEINAETYFIDVSKHMIYRNDGNCFGNSMVKLVADDGRYYEEKNGMVTYYDGKGTKYVGTGASLTFDDWLKSNLPDFSNQFNNAKMYSESGEVIETIEYGRTTAEKRKAEQEEKTGCDRQNPQLGLADPVPAGGDSGLDPAVLQ